MKQMSDVETTTSSRPALLTVLMASISSRGVRSKRLVCIMEAWTLQPRRPCESSISTTSIRSAKARCSTPWRARGGIDGTLTADDLFPFDQDHYGGLGAVDALARRAGISACSRVLDICAGLG